MKRLFAGPWIGEFGWEVMAWQGYLRAIADRYDQVIVCGPTGHDAMYEFADRYIPFDVPTLKANMWMNEPYQERADSRVKLYVGGHEFGAVDWISPEKEWSSLVAKHKAILVNAIQPQKFVRFGQPAYEYDILYHARNRADWDSSYRNWYPGDVERVLSEFPDCRIGCIGKTDMAFYVGGDDLRDIPLSALANIMANSQVMVGPISGPIHFATLCGLPQMTWAVKAEHGQRVRKTWNPHGTRVEVIVGDDKIWKSRTKWTPAATEIANGIRKVFDEVPLRCTESILLSQV